MEQRPQDTPTRAILQMGSIDRNLVSQAEAIPSMTEMTEPPAQRFHSEARRRYFEFKLENHLLRPTVKLSDVHRNVPVAQGLLMLSEDKVDRLTGRPARAARSPTQHKVLSLISITHTLAFFLT